MLSQYCLIKFHKVLGLFYDFRAFISTLRVYSSWLSSSSKWIGEFVHAIPLHWPHADEFSRPCLRQVHLVLAQSDEQLHLIICGCLSVREESNKATGLSFSYSGATLWNSLPYNIRDSSSLNQFKRLLYQYFKYTTFMEIRSVGSFVVK